MRPKFQKQSALKLAGRIISVISFDIKYHFHSKYVNGDELYEWERLSCLSQRHCIGGYRVVLESPFVIWYLTAAYTDKAGIQVMIDNSGYRPSPV